VSLWKWRYPSDLPFICHKAEVTLRIPRTLTHDDLLPLCLLPFAAGMLGHYDQEPVALRIYGLLLVVIAVMRVVIWLYATNRPHLLWQRLDDRQRRAGLALGVSPGLVYLLAFLVARSAPGLSLLIYAGMPVLYFLSITVLRSNRKRNQEYADFT